jgi:hypothetical protein
LISAFGLSFIALLVLLAIRLLRPTSFHVLVFRTALVSSAGGVAVAIPGFFDLSLDLTGVVTRSGGAVAVSLLVYRISAAHIAVDEGHDEEPLELTDGFFLMASTLKIRVAEDGLREIEVLQDAGLGASRIQNRLVEWIDQKISYERETVASFLDDLDEKPQDYDPASNMLRVAWFAPICAASQSTIDILAQAKKEISADTATIEAEVALFKKRLIDLKDEGEKDKIKLYAIVSDRARVDHRQSAMQYPSSKLPRHNGNEPATAGRWHG